VGGRKGEGEFSFTWFCVSGSILVCWTAEGIGQGKDWL
jgi:hypothetical protein